MSVLMSSTYSSTTPRSSHELLTMNGRSNIVNPASYHNNRDSVISNVVILSPNTVAFHPKSLHESKPSIMIRQRPQNYHHVDDNDDEHHEIVIKRRPSFLSN